MAMHKLPDDDSDDADVITNKVKKRAQKQSDKLTLSEKKMIRVDEIEVQGVAILDSKHDKVTDNVPKCNSMRHHLVNEYSP